MCRWCEDHRYRTIDREQVRHMIEDLGMKHHEVAPKIGCSTKYISQYCLRHGIKSQRRGPRGGECHPEWKGGRRIDADGYVLVYTTDHPRKRKQNCVLEHILVMEQHLGRHLLPCEVVHHKNKNKSDNRIENLELFSTNGEHLKHELTGKCPRWTEDGKVRIKAGVRAMHDRIRQKRQETCDQH